MAGLLFAGTDDLERSFRDPPRHGAASPLVALALRGDDDGAAMFRQQLDRVSDLGAGGVLIAVPPADERVWRILSAAVERAHQLGLEVGLCDFPLSAEGAGTFPRARKLVWSSAEAAVFSTNNAPQVYRPPGAYKEIARLAVPADSPEIQPYQVVDTMRDSVPTGGVWRVYRFGHTEVTPAVRDDVDGRTFVRHVNQWLFANQNRLKHAYGTTLAWYHLSGPPASELIWSQDLPAAFLKRSGLRLERYLPALAGVPVGGEGTAAYVRRQIAQTVLATWRARVGRNVEELVYEAGLNAGIRIDEIPVPPEEAALYFRRPMLLQPETAAQRDADQMAGGGARTMGRRQVIGRFDLRSAAATPDAALLPFAGKPEIDCLLNAGATRILLASGGGVPGEDAAFRQMQAVCQYAARCQVMLQHGDAAPALLVWAERPPARLRGYACDYTDGAMLDASAVKKGCIRFDSDREYNGLAVTAGVLRDPTAAETVRRLAERGVRVWLLPEGVEGEDAVFAKMIEKGGAGRIAVIRTGQEKDWPPADFQWRSEAAGLDVAFLQRTAERQDIYLIVNRTAASGPVVCTFRHAGKGVPTRWNPVEGESGLEIGEVTRTPDGLVNVPLFLGPHDACFVVFER